MSKQSYQPATLESLARAHGVEALGVMVDIMRECPSPELRLKAAALVVDRGHGKATQAVITMPVRQAVAAKLYALSDDELLELAAEARNKMAEGGVPPKKGDPMGVAAGAEPLSHAISPMSIPSVTRKDKYKDAVDAVFDELDVAR